MDRDGLGADEQLLADLAVAPPLGDQREDLALPGGEVSLPPARAAAGGRPARAAGRERLGAERVCRLAGAGRRPRAPRPRRRTRAGSPASPSRTAASSWTSPYSLEQPTRPPATPRPGRRRRRRVAGEPAERAAPRRPAARPTPRPRVPRARPGWRSARAPACPSVMQLVRPLAERARRSAAGDLGQQVGQRADGDGAPSGSGPGTTACHSRLSTADGVVVGRQHGRRVVAAPRPRSSPSGLEWMASSPSSAQSRRSVGAAGRPRRPPRACSDLERRGRRAVACGIGGGAPAVEARSSAPSQWPRDGVLEARCQRDSKPYGANGSPASSARAIGRAGTRSRPRDHSPMSS